MPVTYETDASKNALLAQQRAIKRLSKSETKRAEKKRDG